MANPKLFVFFMFFAFLFVRNASQKSHAEPESSISSLRFELEQLKKKISILESAIEKSYHELRSEDDDITEMENDSLEKSESISSLQNKIETLEFQKVSDKQKTTLHMTEQALQAPEEEKMKVEPETTSMKSAKSLIVSHWKFSWRPALDASFPKILEKLAKLRRDGEMCIETLKTEGIPVMKDQWLDFLSSFGPHFESLTAKTIEAYHATKNYLLPSIVKLQNADSPFIQEALKFAKPYINQIEIMTKTCMDSMVVTLEPYSRKLVCAYRMLVTSAITYHKKVQQMLKTNELSRSFASMELAWFAATALLCLPFVFLCKLYSAIFRKKARKFRRAPHSNHIRRKLKRPHDI
ncbi:Coiled-coil domain-containing protein [Senna tora]|uniref:Coiled-coil domain-containing protein n=1 Tax=Senna tora TaxID=362788 RepID=A0A834SMA4_9FABA|nr:Coiled-coil domain-containing protein [Senna tora]